MNRVASFHLATFPLRRSLTKMITVPAERWEVSKSDGCVLGKVLGTSKVGTTRASVELRRWALFAVWEDNSARRAFLEGSEVLERWSAAADAMSTTLLTPIKARGSWGGVRPFNESDERPTEAPSAIAVVTRAAIKPSKLLKFQRAVPPVDDALQQANGCQLALGMGEWPIGQQATYSVWRSEKDLQEFAYAGKLHSDVIKRRYQEGWYSEELFARFAIEPET